MKIIFACGGTGGHIYPAIAMYNEFMSHDPDTNNYLFVGSDYGLEKNIFQTENITGYKLIKSRGIKRSISLSNIKSVWCNIAAFSQAKRIIRDFKPDIIISTGGYPSFHITYYASKYKVPFFFIEGNALPGIVVKLFHEKAKKIFVSTELVKKYLKTDSNICVSGMPSRNIKVNKSKAEIIKDLVFNEDKKIITIIGGSCGSPELNSAVLELIKREDFSYHILWATGKKNYSQVIDRLGNIPENIKIVEYINNMQEILYATDIIISRSGAMTIQEIKNFKLPAILVPFAKAAENHQYINASELESIGTAIIIGEKNISSDILKSAIENTLLNEKKIKDIYENSPAMYSENINENIYDEIVGCIKGDT